MTYNKYYSFKNVWDIETIFLSVEFKLRNKFMYDSSVLVFILNTSTCYLS